MVHQQVVKLLELLQRVLVVLTGALRQDVHLEVSLCNFRLISLLVTCSILLAFALEGLLNKDNNNHSWSGQSFQIENGVDNQILVAVSV